MLFGAADLGTWLFLPTYPGNARVIVLPYKTQKSGARGTEYKKNSELAD